MFKITSEEIQKLLFDNQDEKYGKFQANLTPNIDPDTIIGVRIPTLRKLAKDILKNYDITDYLKELPHKYYDENILHGVFISEMKDYGLCVAALEDFLPYVDNWAVCDTLNPKLFKKHKAELFAKIEQWTASPETYTCRYGVRMLMCHFLDDEFDAKYLEIPVAITNDDYYMKMMIAWYYATALAKQWDATIPYIENKRLEKWIHNKTIQKARESFRVTPNHKEYLKSLKI